MTVLTQKSIIIVDDDSSFLRALERLLKLHGLAVHPFVSVDDFLGQANLEKADCLLLDIHLQGTSGIEVRRLIAKQGFTIPVIFMTGNDSDDLRRAAYEAGCVGYLTKPLSTEVLINTIQAAKGSRAI